MNFYCRVSTPHGLKQTLRFRCNGERAFFLRETLKRYPGSAVKLANKPDKLALPRAEDLEWLRQVLAPV